MNALAKNAYAAYRKNDVQNLRPVEIVSRLYSTLLSRLHTVGASIDSGNMAEKGDAMSLSFAILSELHASLDLEQGGEIAANLNDLYGYLFSELTMVNLHNDKDRLGKAIETIEPLAEAWAELAQKGVNLAVAEDADETQISDEADDAKGASGRAYLASEANVSLSAVL